MCSTLGQYKVAVIGTGPAGIYTAEMISRHPEVANGNLAVHVDLIDRLPTPYGLIRYGVAPDHPRIKGIIDSLHKILEKENARFTGNISFGTDLALDELTNSYDAVVFATGASRDAELNIPGTELQGFHGASRFVSWYDGHPDASNTWSLDASQVGIIGHGNVALDIARILAKDPQALTTTELPDHIQQTLNSSEITDVHVFGRRGPGDVKFTPLELRELGDQPGISVVVETDDHTLKGWPDEKSLTTNQAKQSLATLEQWRLRPPNNGQRTIHLHFYHSPLSVEGNDGKVQSLTFRRTPHASGALQTDEKVYKVQQVYSAIGYKSAPLPGVPFDEDAGVINNRDGRIYSGEQPCPGLYATGWSKRGAVGLIGHTKGDAKQTVAHLIEDLNATPPKNSADDIRTIAAQKGITWTTWDGWLRLDEQEKLLGAQYRNAEGIAEPRDRTKETDRQTMVEVASKGF